MRSLRDRVAVVTEAASGIGRGTSLLLAREGRTVALADVNDGDLQRTASEIEKLGGKTSILIHAFLNSLLTDRGFRGESTAEIQKG